MFKNKRLLFIHRARESEREGERERERGSGDNEVKNQMFL